MTDSQWQQVSVLINAVESRRKHVADKRKARRAYDAGDWPAHEDLRSAAKEEETVAEKKLFRAIRDLAAFALPLWK